MIWTILLIGVIVVGLFYILLRSYYIDGTEKKAPIIFSLVIVCLSVGLYCIIGNIEYADQPYYVLKQKEENLRALSPNDLIARFKAALKHKDTPQARLILANALFRLGNIQEAHLHYKKAYMLDQEKTPKFMLAYAEFLTVVADKKVSKFALSIIDKVLLITPTNIKALFYKGLYNAQQSKHEDAIKIWQKMLENSQDIPYHQMFKQRLWRVIAQYDIKKSHFN